MSINSEEQQAFRFNRAFLQKKAQKNSKDILDEFKKNVKIFFIFHMSFFFIFLCQIIALTFLSLFMQTSTIIAMILASIFLTTFTYFVLLFYFHSKKPEQISALQNKFITTCKRTLSVPSGNAEHHLTVAFACVKLKDSLLENEILKIPKFLQISKILSSYLLKEDIFKFKESLLIAAINEHIHQIKLTPTDLEIHASLANTYTNLSTLYMDAQNKLSISKTKKIFLKTKYDTSIKSTIEEFKILNDYAPNDPWIHLQLASSYQKLNLKKEQIKEYETILKLCPNDNNVLYKLGTLYFEANRNSKGLRIYEELKMRSYKNADQLLSYYGIVKNQEKLEESI